MSRLNSLSQAAIKAMFSSETDDALIMLVTITDPTDPSEPIRLADNYTKRLDAYTTDSDVVYGVTSRGNDYLFLPMQIQLPSESETGTSSCSLVINYVTSEAIELIRSKLTTPVLVTIELVMSKSTNNVEAQFPGFSITSVTYSAEQISFDLSMISYSREPFPCYSFTPANFPGLF